jgi:Tol biopolymer transport system component
MTANGANLKRITPEDRDFFDPVYAPDGTTLMVVSGGVWQIPLSVDGEPVGKPEQIANPAMAQVRNLSFSADGKRVVSSVVRQKGNLWSVPISKTSGERTGQPAPFVEDTSSRKTNPIFSNDGSKVAYTVWIAGFAGSVWTVGEKGNDRFQVTTDPSSIVGWMPEGNRLVSISFHDDDNYLTTTAVDTGMRKTLAKLHRHLPFCRLSPDGKTIAFNAYSDSNVNLWSYSLESETEKQLTFDHELFGFPAWSPDGKWIAGELKRNDDTYVAIVPAEGGAPVQLNSDQGQSWTGSWSPDGNKIAFAGLRNGVWNIWWISVSTREQKQVTNYTKPNSFVRYPTWSPHGDQIVYEYSELTGNVWLADLK